MFCSFTNVLVQAEFWFCVSTKTRDKINTHLRAVNHSKQNWSRLRFGRPYIFRIIIRIIIKTQKFLVELFTNQLKHVHADVRITKPAWAGLQ